LSVCYNLSLLIAFNAGSPAINLWGRYAIKKNHQYLKHSTLEINTAMP